MPLKLDENVFFLVSPRNDQSSSNSSSFIPNSSVFAQINVSNEESKENENPTSLSTSANQSPAANITNSSSNKSLDSSQDSQRPLKGREIAEKVIVPMLTPLFEEYKNSKQEPDIFVSDQF